MYSEFIITNFQLFTLMLGPSRQKPSQSQKNNAKAKVIVIFLTLNRFLPIGFATPAGKNLFKVSKITLLELWPLL